MTRLRELGVRTIISYERPHDSEPDDAPPDANTSGNDTREKASVALERDAAEQVGIRFVLMPMYNSGPNSLEDSADERVLQLLEANRNAVLAAAADGGVLFHCSAGHDRAGIVAAYIRMRDQHWPAEEAIAEMRRYGHNWPKFSHNGGQSSWHEDHLRAISELLAVQAVAKDN